MNNIIIVDDEANILQAIKRELLFFCEEKKLEIVTFNSAIEALSMPEDKYRNTAVIITDQRMPEMKGSEFLFKVRERHPDIVFIILTGHTDIQDIIDLIKDGIFSFILKPWDKNFLIAEIEKALEIYNLRISKKKYLQMIQEELFWSGKLQKALLMRELPQSDLINFIVTYNPLPSLHCGGDYYDIIQIGNTLYIALIGDVSGHGLKGAFVTSILKSIIYSGYISKHKTADFSPADFLFWLNNRVCEELEKVPDILITFSACLLNLEKKEVVYAKAGHLPLILCRENKLLKYDLDGAGMGFKKGIGYNQVKIPLLPKDKFLLFTDGLLEYNSTHNASNFIDLRKIIPREKDSRIFHQKMINNARIAFPGQEFTDDVTLITIDIL